MIFFVDKNNPNYIAYRKFRGEMEALIEASDDERLSYVENFLEWYYSEFQDTPSMALVEKLGNFILRPYIGSKPGMEYKILSVYSLERRESKQNAYMDEVKY